MSITSETLVAERAIPLSVPEIRGNEWRYVKECLDTGWVSSVGGFVDRFERAVADRVGGAYAVATATGTAALHVALKLAGVGPGDEVLVPTLSFIAPANAVRYVGAWPVFIDVEPTFWQMDPGRVVDFLDRECRWSDGDLCNRITGRRVKAVLPVHVLGHPVDMDPVLDAAGKYQLAVIEDAAESLGAEYKGRTVGRLADIGCFSFNGNKTVTACGGGMLVTDDGDLAARAKYLTTQARDDPVEYVHHEVGYNYRLTNVHAAVGLAQIEMLDQYVDAKRRIADTYAKALSVVPGLVHMREAIWARCTYWLYTVLVDEDEYGIDSRTLLSRLRESGIETRPLWQPLHCSPAHSECMHYGGEVAESLYRQALSIPCSVGLTRDDQESVISKIRSLVWSAM